MAKQSGFYVNVKYFIPIDKKNFGKQAAAYATMAEIEKTGALPEGFDGKVVSVAVKAGGYDESDTLTETKEPDPATGDMQTTSGAELNSVQTDPAVEPARKTKERHA